MKPLSSLVSAPLVLALVATILVGLCAPRNASALRAAMIQPESAPDGSVEQRWLALVEEQRDLLRDLPPEQQERWIRALIERLREPNAEETTPAARPPQLKTALEDGGPSSADTPGPTTTAAEPVAPPSASVADVAEPATPETSLAATAAQADADLPRSTTSPPGPSPIPLPPSPDEPDPAEAQPVAPWADSEAAARLSDVDAPAAAAADVPSDQVAPRCNTLVPFDSSGDGRFSAADRNWRHFYLWNDGDGDGVAVEDELTSLYDAGVRSLGMDLNAFEGLDDRAGQVDQGTYLVLRSPKARTKAAATTGRLVVDLEDLVRSTPLLLKDSDGTSLQGIQPLRAGLEIVTVDGGAVQIDCP